MGRRRIRKKIFALNPVTKLLSCVSSKVILVLQFLILLLKFFISLSELFNKGGGGLVPVLRFLILGLEMLVAFFQLFTKGKCKVPHEKGGYDANLTHLPLL
jgi:hypothetical protein